MALNKKNKILIYGIGILLVCIVLMGLYMVNKKNYNIDEQVKYLLITDMFTTTMLNDGGSHTNQYYEINFRNMNVIKYEDKYNAFEGYAYKRKKLYEKKLKSSENKKLKKYISKIIKEKQSNVDLAVSNWKYYILIPIDNSTVDYNNIEELENFKGSIIYNDYEVIELIEDLLKN